MELNDLKDYSEIQIKHCPQCGRKKDKTMGGKEPAHCGGCGTRIENLKLLQKFDPIEFAQLQADAGWGRPLRQLFESDSEVKLELAFELIRIGGWQAKNMASILKEELKASHVKEEEVEGMVMKVAQRMHKKRVKERKLGKRKIEPEWQYLMHHLKDKRTN